MKTQILFAFAFLALTQAGLPDLRSIGTEIPVDGPLIQRIASSQIQQSLVSSYLFDLVDIDKDGYLRKNDFRAILTRLYKMVYNINIASKFVDFNFAAADAAPKDGRISRPEFDFIFAVNLAFTDANYDALTSDDSTTLITALSKLDQYTSFRRPVLDHIISKFDLDNNGSVTFDELKAGLNTLSQEIGLELMFPDNLLVDMISPFDSNGDNILSRIELNIFVYNLIQTIREFVITISQ